MDRFSLPIARIGIIGGGQLGRMMAKAAKRIGCTCVVLDPQPGSPAAQIAGQQIVGHYHDPAKLRELADACDVLTFDIEDIGTETLVELEQEGHAIYPAPGVLALIQDKLTQKQALEAAGIPTAPFVPMPEPTPEAFAAFGYPLVQKARRGGYDGRGVSIIKRPEDFDRHLPVPSLVERFVPARKEVAVLVARGRDGDCRCYPPVEMCFRAGENVLDMLLAPAAIDDSEAEAARALAVRTVEALGGVGVFGVEMFLAEDGSLLVNEVAPRTHNSGHHTIEACVTDQFEQHLRAVVGLPLGSTDQLVPAAMINLLGAPGYRGRPVIRGMAEALAIPGVCVHLYGKATTSPFRKMGHVTVLDTDIEQAREKALRVRELIEITGEEQA
ncbi:5-(carboxyamino)imidazole ribonucleotide synthase [Marichromatium gracile]|uniref:N5-carboxyaminoimidazole ribonucleotide synthase n=2 Tax=Marichromatium TaxID=85076 RepID=W0E0F0_MARPU|nr:MULTISPECIES: 5-(carboxyamino)imidazole ribonucleotide synthase [Marichromatium]AHF02596.1 phosphoribosylaminoimidazole carboxylase [Marichromatium purpuratum 984]KXX64678.1 5-(carboxyamino)imidazole ribonucleotide synthase [Marichromatium gracile]MCF1184643.1 5-(carboxyamino)imidazole ribonucleotide synthase [Marichromatium gracile]